MEYEIRIDPETGCAAIRVHGPAEAGAFERLSEELAGHPDWKRGSDVLIDARDVELAAMATGEVQRLVNFARGFHRHWGDARVAIVTSGVLAFGLARMWESQVADRVEARNCIFKSIDEARAWLGGSGRPG